MEVLKRVDGMRWLLLGTTLLLIGPAAVVLALTQSCLSQMDYQCAMLFGLENALLLLLEKTIVVTPRTVMC